jgi:hypothetical protein
MKYTVIYRTGGWLTGKWFKVLETYPILEAAGKCKAEIERMGYKALVHETEKLEALGMPEGWEP